MFRSVRTKLAASYALIVLVCLILAGLGALILIRRYQRDAALSQQRSAATILAQRVQSLLVAHLDAPAIVNRIRQESHRLGARTMLVMRDGLIVGDTEEDPTLAGKRIRFSLPDLLGTRATLVVRRPLGEDGQPYFLVITELRPPAVVTPAEARTMPGYLIVALPEADAQPAWRDLVRPLALAASLSLLISVLIAIVLSRSITRPLLAMTAASEEIARGNYGQVIPAQGQDEVARLADSFNRMARQVQHSRQSQRDFVANVSHDLKTPLTSIQGFSQAILDGAVHDQEGYSRAAQIISDEAGRMGQLIQRLLDLARLDAGEVLQRRTGVDPAAFIEHCLEKLRPLAADSGVELCLSIPQALPAIYGDEDYLEQSLSNLVDNALRYSSAGGRVKVAAQVLASQGGKIDGPALIPYALPIQGMLDNGRWLAITVEDTGTGIAAEDLPRLFERFYRADKSRSRAKGSGLGLAIAREIVEGHGGAIGVTSRGGHGSCFTIFLPLRQAPSPQDLQA